MKTLKLSEIYKDFPGDVIKKVYILFLCFLFTGVGLISAGVQQFLSGMYAFSMLSGTLVLVSAVGVVFLFSRHLDWCWGIATLIIISLYFSRVFFWPASLWTVFYAMFMCSVLFYVGVNWFKRKIGIIIYHLILYTSVLSAFFFVSLPIAIKTNQISLFFDMFWGSFFIFAIFDALCFVSWRGTQEMAIKLLEKEKDLEKNIETMTDIVNNLSERVNIGQELDNISGAIIDSAYSMEKSTEETHHNKDELRNQIDMVNNLLEQVLEANESIRQRINNQAVAFDQTSSAISEMSTSIGQMSSSANEKIDRLNQISSVVKEGINKLDSTVEIFDSVIQSINEMSEIVSVIEDISERTNLLAMNASIESVHAGEAGKGFSIVAQSIRDLSEETSKNSKIIAQMIKKNIKDVKEAVAFNTSSSSDIRNIGSDLILIANSLTEINHGLSELSEGTVEVNRAVSHVSDLKKEVDLSTDKMNVIISEEADAMTKMMELASSIEENMGELNTEFEKIIQNSRSLNEISQSNQAALIQLKTDIDNL